MSKDQLFTRTYEAVTGETVVVIGNRRDLSDEVPEIIECEFVFRDGKLVTAHVLQFEQAAGV
jgi:hypothetical protein